MRSVIPQQWGALGAAILIEVCGTLLLKPAVDRPALLLLTLLCYGLAIALLTVSLRAGMTIGVAYGMWAAIGVVATALLASWLFDESLTPVKGIGFLVIAIGVILVEFGARRTSSSEEADA